MIYFLAIGAALGLSSGLAPGPLLTLVAAETLRHGVKAGIKVALAPLITDLPIIALTLLILSRLSDSNRLLGIVALAGGCLLLYLGGANLRAPQLDIAPAGPGPGPLFKGILANILNPHPYLFWGGVGAPLMAEASRTQSAALPAFLLGFYLCLVGAKILLAALLARSQRYIAGQAFRWVIRALGLVLCLLALTLFHDGLELLGLIGQS